MPPKVSPRSPRFTIHVPSRHTSPHLATPRHISPHLAASRHTSPYLIAPHRIPPHLAASRCDLAPLPHRRHHGAATHRSGRQRPPREAGGGLPLTLTLSLTPNPNPNPNPNPTLILTLYQAEADQIAFGMAAKNVPVEYVLYPDEGHGFARPVSKVRKAV